MKNLNDFDEPFTTNNKGFRKHIITKGDRKALFYKFIGFWVMKAIIYMVVIKFSLKEESWEIYTAAIICYVFLAFIISNRKIIYAIQLIKTGCFRESDNQKIPKRTREEMAYFSTKELFSSP